MEQRAPPASWSISLSCVRAFNEPAQRGGTSLEPCLIAGLPAPARRHFAARRHLRLDQHEVPPQVADVIDDALGAAVGDDVLEHIVPRRPGRAVRGVDPRRDALFDAVPLRASIMKAPMPPRRFQLLP